MSTRAIAPAVGVSNKTVSTDLRTGVTSGNTSPDPETPASLAEDVEEGRVIRITGPNSWLNSSDPTTPERINHETGEIIYDQPEPTRPTNPTVGVSVGCNQLWQICHS